MAPSSGQEAQLRNLSAARCTFAQASTLEACTVQALTDGLSCLLCFCKQRGLNLPQLLWVAWAQFLVKFLCCWVMLCNAYASVSVELLLEYGFNTLLSAAI